MSFLLSFVCSTSFSMVYFHDSKCTVNSIPPRFYSFSSFLLSVKYKYKYKYRYRYKISRQHAVTILKL